MTAFLTFLQPTVSSQHTTVKFRPALFYKACGLRILRTAGILKLLPESNATHRNHKVEHYANGDGFDLSQGTPL